MKKIYLFLICYSVLLLGGCDDNQESLFQGEHSLHFKLSASQQDSMVYSFILTSDNFIQVNLPVELEGYGDVDRSFRLKVDASQTTAVEGKHYRLLEDHYVMAQGTHLTQVPVTMLYSGELDSTSVRLCLQLEPLDGMVTGIAYLQQVVIVVNNQLEPIDPEDWDWDYSYYFGEYSKVKHRYILSELQLKEIVHFEDIDEWGKLHYTYKDAYRLHMNNFFATHAILNEYGKPIEPWIN